MAEQIPKYPASGLFLSTCESPPSALKRQGPSHSSAPDGTWPLTAQVSLGHIVFVE